MYRMILGIGVCTAVGATLALATGGREPPQQDPTPRVAVVDVMRLVVEQQKHLDERQRIDEWRRNLRSSLVESRAELTKLRDNLDQMEPGSDAYWSLRKDVGLGLARQRNDEDGLQLSLETQLAYGFSAAHFRVTRAIREYAAKEGLDLILNSSLQPVDGGSRAEVVSRILLQSVMHRTDELDVTDEVLELLNSKK